MAVPFRKTSKAAKRKRRSHFKIALGILTDCKNCGSFIKPHHICKECGFYKKQEIIKAK